MIKKISFAIAILIVCFIPAALTSCSAMGTNPSKSDQLNFKSSNQFFPEKEEFDNIVPHLKDSMQANFSMIDVIWDDMWAKDNTPSELLPQIKPDLKAFQEPSDKIKSIWLGHSSFLLNIDGKMVLLDPVFGEEASPVFFAVNRYQESVISLEELPPIDVIVISHDHYDHLDIETVEFFVGKKTHFVTPLGVGSHLRGWGIEVANISENDWWEAVTIDSIEYTATPAQHFSGRGLDANRTLWASWVIQSKNQKIYFSGDSGYSLHFKEIANRLGPFDFAYLECGQYNEAWAQIHMSPDQIVQAYQDLGVKQAQPIHWGMFDLSLHAWYEPIEAIHSRHQKGLVNIVAPKIGETIVLGQEFEVKVWWEH